MKLSEALAICRSAPADAEPFIVAFACGFTPLHLETLLAAHLQSSYPDRRVQIIAGQFGDCLGNVERLTEQNATSGAVVLEWPDLDPRLGLRQLGGWLPAQLADILETASANSLRMAAAVRRAAESLPLAVCLPTLPLPPIDFTASRQAGSLEIGLRRLSAELANQCVAMPNVKLVSPQELDQSSPTAERYQVGLDLAAGFPYRTAHADVLARLLAELIVNRPPKKGIITDLDDTLWRGIVGEVGPSEVHWDLDHASQMHGVYQQLLASLAAAGVLIAVASKNDADVVEEVFHRPDMLLPRNRVFPAEVHWNSKVDSVGRILAAWNISADDVVMVDDTQLHLAEVQAAHPAITCLEFPRDDDEVAWKLIRQLRNLCGKDRISSEDALRLDSLVQNAQWSAQIAERDPAEAAAFLAKVDAHVTFSRATGNGDTRALELINKTNQFNLNGRRIAEGQWQSLVREPGTELITVDYRDKFGSLGKIAAIVGRKEQQSLRVLSWVMSCRAFSRQIEFCALRELFDRFDVDAVSFDYEPTSKNGPMRSFLEILGTSGISSEATVSRDQFTAVCPSLSHQVTWQA